MRRKNNAEKLIVLLSSHLLVLAIGFILAYQLKTPIIIEQPIQMVQLPAYQNYSASTNILAVKGDGSSGVLGTVIVEVRPGQGRVLMNMNPFLEPDTQYSAETAVKVAQDYTKKSLEDRDIIISFDITGRVLGGPSAGAAMTVATIAAIEERELRSDVAITGTILKDGTIGIIGGILEKAQAAGTNNMKIFLVPEGLSILTYYEKEIKKERIAPGFIIQRVKYIPKTLDLYNHTMTEYNMMMKEVRNIEDVAAIMLK